MEFTKRRKAICTFLAKFKASHGYGPTIRQIGAGWASPPPRPSCTRSINSNASERFAANAASPGRSCLPPSFEPGWLAILAPAFPRGQEQQCMRNNWVLLKGRLCHTPNYSSTKKGLHKVSFRFAIPRPQRTPEETATPEPEGEDTPSTPLPQLSADSDFVTVIIIGKLAWDFKQLNLQKGAAVRVQGRLRSWISQSTSPGLPYLTLESSHRPARPNGRGDREARRPPRGDR